MKRKTKVVAVLLALSMIVGNVNVTLAESGDDSSVAKVNVSSEANLIWSDEFEGNTLDRTKWNNEGATGGGGYGNQELQNYQMDYCEVNDGNLVIKPQFQWDKSTQRAVSGSYYSTKLWTKGLESFKYGKIEIRAKMPKGQGLWTLGWMLGENDSWPLCGEIDIFETANTSSNTLINQSIHCNRFNGMALSSGPKYRRTNISDATSEYHTYGIIWDEEKIVFTIDEIETWTYDPDLYDVSGDGNSNEDIWPYDQPFYLILSCAIGGVLGGDVNPDYWTKIAEDGNIETYQDYFYIDYVRVYELPEENEEQSSSTEDTSQDDSKYEFVNMLSTQWDSYFGVNEGWWEGAEGTLIQNKGNWIANLDIIGWGGIWGGQIFQRYNLDIEKGKEYTFRCSLSSSNCDKWVFISIDSDYEKYAYAKWVYLPKGVTVNLDETFVAKYDADSIFFGVGGEFGDRIGVDEDAELRYSYAPDGPSSVVDVDAMAATQIKCNNAVLALTSDIKKVDDIAEITEVSTPIIGINGNSVTVSWTSTLQQNQAGQLYNLYLDGKIVYAGIKSGTYTIGNLNSGNHTIKVTAVLNDEMTKGKEISFVIQTKQTSQNTQKPQTTNKSVANKPAKVKSFKTKNIKGKKVKLTWKKVKNISGYEIIYATNKKFTKGKKTVKVKAKAVSKIIKKLKKKKTYYFRIRAYKMVNKKKVYGVWSSKKKVKIKK